MKDIDKMSHNELRAEVRVLRTVYEAATFFNDATDRVRLTAIDNAIAEVKAPED